ncbi:MAG: glycerate kinase [Eudoraea sp.]|nr:glycerate kinase [Eudoraea sp.]
MQVLLAPDKFKGSLSAREVIEALSGGIRSVFPDVHLYQVQASDGGDGFLDAVSHYCDTEKVEVLTEDPLGRPLQAPMRINRDQGEAYIEMAQASGLVLLDEEERSAVKTSSKGTGIQIREALKLGLKKIYIGLGGSATNDGGMGMATALGYRFLDVSGNPLKPVGANLQAVQSIDTASMLPELAETLIYAVNDVNNPLYGPDGAAYVYAAQKGADLDQIQYLDQGLRQLDLIVQKELGESNAELRGAGAAGGAAFGLKSFMHAEFISGTAFILDLAHIPQLLSSKHFDYIITGEGKIDTQTLSGKWINGVMELGQTYGIPVVAVCGMLDVDPEELRAAGLFDAIEVRKKNESLEYNMKNAAELLKKAITRYFTDLKS